MSKMLDESVDIIASFICKVRNDWGDPDPIKEIVVSRDLHDKLAFQAWQHGRSNYKGVERLDIMGVPITKEKYLHPYDWRAIHHQYCKSDVTASWKYLKHLKEQKMKDTLKAIEACKEGQKIMNNRGEKFEWEFFRCLRIDTVYSWAPWTICPPEPKKVEVSEDVVKAILNKHLCSTIDTKDEILKDLGF